MILSPEFSPAYLITNEDWRTLRSMTSNAKRVLTVAGSGDQALSYVLSGATHVDTYDISRCPHIIQDIKTTALQILTYSEYMDLIQKFGPNISLNLPLLKPIMQHLPPETIAEIHKYPNQITFQRNAHSYNQNYFTDTEYMYLKSKITKPFKFYLSDIKTLHTQLTEEYDLIDTSNIFDFNFTLIDLQKTIESLLPYMRIGGRLIYIWQYQKTKIDNIKLESCKILKQKIPGSNKEIMIFQRTR